MEPTEKAVAYFMRGYNCAQATAAPFADRVGLDQQTVLRLMAGFGAGMGGARGVCGAVSAMVFVAGATRSYDPADRAAKKTLYDRVKQMLGEFTRRHATTDCGELLRAAACAPAPDPSERNSEYYAKRPCARFVATAADIIAETLGRQGA